ncbi:MAG: HAD family hydrolase [bacterium]
MADIRLIVVDLDGTMMGPREDVHAHAEAFRTVLDRLAVAHGTKWAVNTGRGIFSFRRVFRVLFDLGISPDFIVVRHAYIFSVRPWGYMPHLVWNTQIAFSILVTRLRTKRIIKRFKCMILSMYRRARCCRIGTNAVSFKFRDSETTDAAYYQLRVLSQPYKNLIVYEYVKEVMLSTIPFTKGLAVAHLSRHLDTPRENILCIGNGHNDMSMLDGTAAAMTACPANASVEVMQAVHRSFGHISRQSTLAGTIEAIQAYESGTVNSELPPDIALLLESARRRNPTARDSGRDAMIKDLLRELFIVALCCSAALLALASAGMLGSLSKHIMLPVERAAELVALLTLE